MGHFFDRDIEGETHYYVEYSEAEMELTQENCFGNFHETFDEERTIRESADSHFDRVAILDPSDDTWFLYWRFDYPEQFPELEFIVRRCGSYLVRRTVLENIREQFFTTHPLTDEDVEHLLNG